MQINFSQIFNTEPPPLPIKILHDQQSSTTYGRDSIFVSTVKQHENHKAENLKSNKKEAVENKVMKILQTAFNAESPGYHWYQSSQLDEASYQHQQNYGQSMKKCRKNQSLSAKQAMMLTDRLSQPITCRKQKCKDIIEKSFQDRIKEEILPIEAPKKRHNRSLTQTCEFYSKNPSQLHERLYMQYKSREFKGLELEQYYEQMQQQKQQKYENKEYLQKYVKFYDRLDDEVLKKFKKQKYYEEHPYLSMGAVTKFQPNTTASKNSLSMLNTKPSIQPKYQKNQIKGKAEMNLRSLQHTIMNASLNNSLQNSLNKSLEIVHRKSQDFINRICNVFEEDGEFVVSPENINELTEGEFEIVFPLIQMFEAHGDEAVSIETFKKQLRKFCESMPIIEKQKIRKVEGNRSFVKIKAPDMRKISHKNRHGDYLKKLQNFI